MYQHIQLGATEETRQRQLASLIRSGAITMAGYKRTKVYGLLHCNSGKRMKTLNRVFFKDEQEAITNNYRPCGTCLRKKYERWKGITHDV